MIRACLRKQVPVSRILQSLFFKTQSLSSCPHTRFLSGNDIVTASWLQSWRCGGGTGMGTKEKWETIQLVQCLLCKHECLCLSPSTHAKVLGGVHVCNLSTGEAETGRSLGLTGQSVSPNPGTGRDIDLGGHLVSHTCVLRASLQYCEGGVPVHLSP